MQYLTQDGQEAKAAAERTLARQKRAKRHATLLKIQGHVFDAMMDCLDLPDWEAGGDGKEMFNVFSGLLTQTRKKVSDIYDTIEVPEKVEAQG
jgi:hypothetical protein